MATDADIAPVAALLGERLEVDVDEVVGQALGQAAHEEHAQVLDQLLLRYAERGGGLVEAYSPAGVQERHQGEQARDLLLRSARGGRGGAHASTAWRRAISLGWPKEPMNLV